MFERFLTLSSRVAYPWLRPLLFSLDAERAHESTLQGLELAYRAGLLPRRKAASTQEAVSVMGLRFANPVGLAAGLDKNAAHLAALATLGFGFVEAGTVTPLAQAGNPRPRLFRLPAARALINRFGFNNEGLESFVRNCRAALPELTRRGQPLGANIGKNAATPNERAIDDYRLGLQAVYATADYVTINISSPNTRGLRELQGGDELVRLLDEIAAERHRLEDVHGRRVPVAVKIAPDLDDDALRGVADTLVAREIDAVIATNTTTARDAVAQLPHGQEAGGLSGAPLTDRSTAVIDLLARHLGGRLPIIGVGGIMCGDDAVAKMQAGASLVQVYTGLVYRGPELVRECRASIQRWRAGQGILRTGAGAVGQPMAGTRSATAAAARTEAEP